MAGSIGVIAGGGQLPAELLREVEARGQPFHLLAIEGEADPDGLAEFEPQWFNYGQIGSVLDTLHRLDCTSLVLIGSVKVRPDLKLFANDLATLWRLPKIIGALTGGDDSLLRRIIRFIEAEGFQVLGVRDVAPNLIASAGLLTRARPDRLAQSDASVAIASVLAVGLIDAGQAAVVVNGRVVALEAAEGTDALLERVADLRSRRRFGAKGQAGVLVKTAKPGQDLRVDLPAIGPQTIHRAAEAKLAGLVLQADHILIADRAATIAEADRLGLFVEIREIDAPAASVTPAPGGHG